MAAVQNFSLPGRTGQAYPVSPALSLDDRDHQTPRTDHPPIADDPGPHVERVLVRYHAHTVGSRPSLGTRVFSPSPSAVQLFRFSDEPDNGNGSNDYNTNTNDHPTDPPRPLSTASAPALPTAGSVSRNIAWGMAVALSPSQASVGHHTGSTLHGNMDNASGRESEKPADVDTTTRDRSSRPISSIASWPWPPPSPPPSSSSSSSSSNTERAGQPGPSTRATAGDTTEHGPSGHRSQNQATRPRQSPLPSPSHRSDDPPALIRSISVRWGPNDRRHVSLEPGQSADDAARAVAAHRRRRRIVIVLLVVSGAGALSTAGAIATAGAQANTDVVLDKGTDAHPVLHAGTLGWLIASLLVSVGAVCCCFLYVAEKPEWPWNGTWWKKPGAPGTSGTSGTPGTSAAASGSEGVLADIVEEEEPESRAPETTRWWQQRPRPLSCLLRPLHCGRSIRDNDDNNNDNSGEHSDGWVEMDNLGASAGIWETPTVHENRRIPQLWRSLSTKPPQSVKGKEVERTADHTVQSMVDAVTATSTTPPPPIPDEDRNWAKFAGDPVQLRRYVESLEARLALAEGRCQRTAEGVHAADVAEEADAGPSASASTDHEPTPTPPPTPPQPGRALTSGFLRTQPSTDTILPVIGGLSFLTDPDESSNSLLLLLPRRGSARLSGRDMDLAVASGRRMLEAVVAATAVTVASAGTAGTLVEMGSRSEHRSEPPSTRTTPSGTQSSILTQLYAAYGEERGPWSDPRERRERGE